MSNNIPSFRRPAHHRTPRFPKRLLILALLCAAMLTAPPPRALAQDMAPDISGPAAPSINPPHVNPPSLAPPQNGTAPAAASQPPPPVLVPPAGCLVGRDCWITNHVDTDPAPDQVADYQCGTQVTDAHQGIDFTLRDLNAMQSGVTVMAATHGKVLRVRDGIPDRLASPPEIEKMLAENRGCGNGVVIEYGHGWSTIYCHLRQGSILVKPDDRVTAGQPIAQIGASGAAEAPHLHFGVFHVTTPVDPFTGVVEGRTCTMRGAPLWLAGVPLPYEPLTLYAAGFSDDTPAMETLLQSAANADAIPANAPLLSFWGLVYNSLAGDEIALRILTPDGQVFAERTLTEDESRSRQYYYVGRRNRELLVTGPYTGTMTVTRTLPDGQKITRQIHRAVYVQ